MTDRKIIFKCRVGSHLYGTNRSESDEDFYGVFLPSTEDLLSLTPTPKNGELDEGEKLSNGPKNQAGDTDCKFFTLQKFLRLAAEGQPGQLEMLFAPDSMVLLSTPEWEQIKASQNLFLSKKGVSAFLGFALAQAYRAVIKGENLNKIQDIISWSTTLTPQQMNAKLNTNYVQLNDKAIISSKSTPYASPFQKLLQRFGFSKAPKKINTDPIELKWYVNEHGFPQIEVAGRNFDVGTKTKTFIEALKLLESKYGTRVRAAAEADYDYKSLGHAVRLLGEAEEFLAYGKITLPRPDAEYLKTILRGTISDSNIDWFNLLNSKIDHIKQVIEPNSPNPNQPNWKGIDKLCVQILRKHLDE